MLNKMYDVVMRLDDLKVRRILSIFYENGVNPIQNNLIMRELNKASKFELKLMLVLILCDVEQDYVLEIFRERVYHENF